MAHPAMPNKRSQMIAPAELKRPTECRFILFLLSLCDYHSARARIGQLLEPRVPSAVHRPLMRGTTNNTVSSGVLVRMEFNCLQHAILPRGLKCSRVDAFFWARE